MQEALQKHTDSPLFTGVLIANRGEIAVRIAKTLRKLGIRSYGVFSEADRYALHTRTCDQALSIGGTAAQDSYLSVEKIIAACKKCGAQAVHPGYGFLSENAAFVEALTAAGIVFIGPRSEQIKKLGDKIEARALAQRLGIPTIPGVALGVVTQDTVAESFAALKPLIAEVGFPLLIKAAGGGGGRGMREVNSEAEFASAVLAASREAQAFFSDGRVFVEKYLSNPRHVEVQIFGDTHGTVVSLGERDCSVQRNHQKVLEEAPSCSLSQTLRSKLERAAIALGTEARYENAGTVEFLIDEDRYYFIEANTRLQVEHPLTETLTGLDLVELQVRVACGQSIEKLITNQETELTLGSYALELRLCAEDEHSRPSSGRLLEFTIPGKLLLRIDSGFEKGDLVSHYYDSLLAKLIFTGSSRNTVIHQARAYLASLSVLGVFTNIPLLLKILSSTRFQTDTHSTRLLNGEIAPDSTLIPADTLFTCCAALFSENLTSSPFTALSASSHRLLQRGPDLLSVTITASQNEFTCHCLNKTSDSLVTHQLTFWVEAPAKTFHFSEGAVEYHASVRTVGQHIWISLNGITRVVQRHVTNRAAALLGSTETLLAPLPGSILSVPAQPGSAVQIGDTLVVIESMKMEHSVVATVAGKVANVLVVAGQQVVAQQPLVEISP